MKPVLQKTWSKHFVKILSFSWRPHSFSWSSHLERVWLKNIKYCESVPVYIFFQIGVKSCSPSIVDLIFNSPPKEYLPNPYNSYDPERFKNLLKVSYSEYNIRDTPSRIPPGSTFRTWTASGFQLKRGKKYCRKYDTRLIYYTQLTYQVLQYSSLRRNNTNLSNDSSHL